MPKFPSGILAVRLRTSLDYYPNARPHRSLKKLLLAGWCIYSAFKKMVFLTFIKYVHIYSGDSGGWYLACVRSWALPRVSDFALVAENRPWVSLVAPGSPQNLPTKGLWVGKPVDRHMPACLGAFVSDDGSVNICAPASLCESVRSFPRGASRQPHCSISRRLCRIKFLKTDCQNTLPSADLNFPQQLVRLFAHTNLQGKI